VNNQNKASSIGLDSGEANVVGYCAIGEDHYPIVKINNYFEPFAPQSKSTANHPSINYLSIFEIDGQQLAITIKPNDSANHSSDTSIFLTKREGEIVTNKLPIS
jgi:hypothetical protein